MWLHTKYERKLLSYYSRQIKKVGINQYFNMEDLIKALGELTLPKLSMEMICCTYRLLENTHDLLSQRGLIKWENPPGSINIIGLQNIPKTSKALGLTDIANIKFSITLTLEGYELGKKYSSHWFLAKLWYEEYIKNHPIWLLVSYMAGIISMLLVNWLSSFFGAK